MKDRTRRVRRIFTRAVELHGAARERHLDDSCADPDLRREVESLLDHLEAARDFLDRPAVPLRPPPPVVGDVLGDYRIVRILGEGAAGVVYEAHDDARDRRVALKVLKGLWLEGRSTDRFRREAGITMRLRHPNIVAVEGLHEASGHLFLVSELAGDRNLSQYLRARGGRLPEHDAAALVAAVADALDHAHREGVIHRDVKPANVLMELDGTPRLTDFGQAKDLDGSSLSRSGDLTGTLPYMSPEQATAATPKLDKRTDVFSLGVLLYELLTGRRPFAGTDRHEIIHAISHDEPPAFPGSLQLSAKIDTITRKALEKDRRHRYRTAGELAADLRALVAGKDIRARRPGALRKADDFRRRHRGATAAIVSLALGAPLAIVAFRMFTDPSPRIAVRTDPPGAELTAIRIHPEDGSLGSPAAIGRSPRDAVRLRAGGGIYRIVAAIDGVGWAEATRVLPERSVTEVALRIVPTGDVTEGMALVDLDDSALAGRVRAAYPAGSPPGSFWIDRFEVTNAAFRRFLEETGSGYRPALWPAPEAWDPAWDPLPVSGIPFAEAQAYAEWAGKRLPTREEWDLASRGPDAALYPWGGTEVVPSTELRGMANEFGDRHDVMWSGPDRFPELAPFYAASVVPAAFLPAGSRDSSWAGLYHTLGNVAEWTESVPVQETPQYALRIIKGDHWGRDINEHWSLSSFMTWGATGGAQLGCGFRCAKTVLDHAHPSPDARSTDGRK